MGIVHTPAGGPPPPPPTHPAGTPIPVPNARIVMCIRPSTPPWSMGGGHREHVGHDPNGSGSYTLDRHIRMMRRPFCVPPPFTRSS